LPSFAISVNSTGAELHDVTVLFIIDDLGQVSVDNSPAYQANATTRVAFRPLPNLTQPPGESGTLTITAAVAGSVGLLIIALVAFFVRRRLSHPDDKYFAEATMPDDATSVSPLYKSQFTEHFNVLYNPDHQEIMDNQDKSGSDSDS